MRYYPILLTIPLLLRAARLTNLALEAKLIERLDTPPKLFTEDLW